MPCACSQKEDLGSISSLRLACGLLLLFHPEPGSRLGVWSIHRVVFSLVTIHHGSQRIQSSPSGVDAAALINASMRDRLAMLLLRSD